ncbi:MAG: CCA tRNA nucleotidyltransferase [bacterium]|nr:CCA tRNA nucleotidyltransferase [bacterium]
MVKKMNPAIDKVLAYDSRLLRIWHQMGSPPAILVGGYIRDRLLGRSSLDLDFTIEACADATAACAQRLARALRTGAHLIGRPPRAVWRVETAHEKVEMIALGDTSREEDILRRDFSCNALAWVMPSGPLIDLCNGQDGISERQLVSIAEDNLRQDPVRMLRGARLVSQLRDFDIESATSRQISELATRVSESPRERVGQELLLLLRGPFAARGLDALCRHDLMAHSVPPDTTFDSAWLSQFIEAADTLASPSRHPLRAAAAVNPEVSRLGFLLRSWRVSDARATAQYGWPRALRRHASTVSLFLDRTVASCEGSLADRRELIFRAGHAFPSLLSVAAAVDLVCLQGSVESWRRWWRLWQRSGATLIHPPQFLTAKEIANRFDCSASPELGRWIDRLKRATARGEIRSTQAARSFLDDLNESKS